MEWNNEYEEFDNLNAFRPNSNAKCEACEASPTVNATGLCGPCTFGEASTIDGAWWNDKDEARWKELKDKLYSSKEI